MQEENWVNYFGPGGLGNREKDWSVEEAWVGFRLTQGKKVKGQIHFLLGHGSELRGHLIQALVSQGKGLDQGCMIRNRNRDSLLIKEKHS